MDKTVSVSDDIKRLYSSGFVSISGREWRAFHQSHGLPYYTRVAMGKAAHRCHGDLRCIDVCILARPPLPARSSMQWVRDANDRWVARHRQGDGIVARVAYYATLVADPTLVIRAIKGRPLDIPKATT